MRHVLHIFVSYNIGEGNTCKKQIKIIFIFLKKFMYSGTRIEVCERERERSRNCLIAVSLFKTQTQAQGICIQRTSMLHLEDEI